MPIIYPGLRLDYKVANTSDFTSDRAINLFSTRMNKAQKLVETDDLDSREALLHAVANGSVVL
jgi:hypothetical protein